MAHAKPAEGQSEDESFLDKSIVEALVPANPQLSLKELVEAESQYDDESNHSLLPWVKQRDYLLLDEMIQGLVVLKTTLVEEQVLQSLLDRLEVSVELYATGISPAAKSNEARPAPVREVLSEANVDVSQEPVVIAGSSQQGPEDEAEPCLFVLWKVEIPLSRPRAKLHKLSVYLSPTVALKERTRSSDDEPEQYLPSMVPQSINLLQPFEFDPRFRGKHPYMPASRVTKVAPAAPPPKDVVQRVRSVPRRLFRAGPALFWRVRFSHSPPPPKTNFLFASLELEVSPLWHCNISVKDVKLHLAQGEVVFLGPALPGTCKPGDQFTVLYKLVAPSDNSNNNGVSSKMTDELDIGISAVAEISSVCTPAVNIAWTTTADFTEQQKPRPRPASQASKTIPALPAPAPAGPDSLPYSGQGAFDKPAAPAGPTGITVTITGPDRIVVGKPFRWEIFVVNRSDSVQNLAIRPIRSLDGQLPASKLAPLDGNVYNMPISWFFEPAELTCLSTVVRTGQLAASACCTTELKFLAATPGVLQLDAIRMVNLATRQATDVTDLPDIVAFLED